MNKLNLKKIATHGTFWLYNIALGVSLLAVIAIFIQMFSNPTISTIDSIFGSFAFAVSVAGLTIAVVFWLIRQSLRDLDVTTASKIVTPDSPERKALHAEKTRLETTFYISLGASALTGVMAIGFTVMLFISTDASILKTSEIAALPFWALFLSSLAVLISTAGRMAIYNHGVVARNALLTSGAPIE